LHALAISQGRSDLPEVLKIAVASLLLLRRFEGKRIVLTFNTDDFAAVVEEFLFAAVVGTCTFGPGFDHQRNPLSPVLTRIKTKTSRQIAGKITCSYCHCRSKKRLRWL
jgi:hypothetical protein